MECNRCGNQSAYRMRYTSEGEWCDRCGSLGLVNAPDVFFRTPYLDPNLAHPNRPWEKDGVWITSKRHKARILAEQGLREAGDKRHGSRNFDPASARINKWPHS